MSSLLQQTWQTLIAHRMKSILAIIAIAWGVISVVVLIALGEGFYRHQSQSFSFMVNNVQVVFPSQTSKPWQGLPSRREIDIPQDKVEMIKQSGFVKEVASVYAKWDASVTNIKGQNLARAVSGIDPAYFALAERKLQTGSRNISPSDIASHTRVAVLGDQIAKMGGIGIGEEVKVNGIPFLVIGVLSDEDTGISFGDSRRVFIPQTTYRDLWNDKPWMLLMKPIDGMDSASFRESIVRFYAKQLHFDPSDKDAVRLPDFSEGAAVISGILRGIQIFLGASGAMTMAVGALGVANIMFLSVTERTREIGVRLAIGATQVSILSQFIIEGLILVAVGTAIGLMISFALVALLSTVALPEWIGSPVITPDSIALSLLVTVVLALMASYFPARRASRLTPVLALSARA
ncbi:ABC transporter substrate-binding protein [Vibrio coralliilyticus]|uniref:ABC transporter substrate-binding protein n=1 Tax=Vibrio coralliilyticus TaxID=190893 RepID=A0A7Y4BKU8_9VIBR|nr:MULTISPECIES: ABC transporter permease [Vibrio]KJY68268.1 ABC transporter substrate-binding protein [Vibrio coralliilyticus]NOI28269.1 ABC transporter permease [Vibrio coralliilyticus]NOI49209.1 ABC transporter permease [Vibrio coralliilyticus]NRF28608.1 ABC transporter permease [Vibrio coralliilyticus]NRF51581.1 ABC transporter permease [Vibrio coralliilyticus]